MTSCPSDPLTPRRAPATWPTGRPSATLPAIRIAASARPASSRRPAAPLELAAGRRRARGRRRAGSRGRTAAGGRPPRPDGSVRIIRTSATTITSAAAANSTPAAIEEHAGAETLRLDVAEGPGRRVADVGGVGGHERQHPDRFRRQDVGAIAAANRLAAPDAVLDVVVDLHARDVRVLAEHLFVDQPQAVLILEEPARVAVQIGPRDPPITSNGGNCIAAGSSRD